MQRVPGSNPTAARYFICADNGSRFIVKKKYFFFDLSYHVAAYNIENSANYLSRIPGGKTLAQYGGDGHGY